MTQTTSTGCADTHDTSSEAANRQMISIEKLAIGYRLRHNETKIVAQGITASIESGGMTCLLGANGVGKSTLLRTLSGFQPTLSGRICIGGKDMLKMTRRQMSRTIGVVLTTKLEVRNMTVEEMVGMGRNPYTGFWGTLTANDREVVCRAMALVGISDFADRMIQTLSDGERQKVMIAKTLAQETPVIYLDEPTAFLDFPSKVDVMQLLLRLAHEEGKTVFLSTHDLELALQMADTLWMMDRRQGLSIGSPHELADNGVLSRYIENDNISFDTHNLDIRVNKK